MTKEEMEECVRIAQQIGNWLERIERPPVKRVCLGCGSEKLLRKSIIMSYQCEDCGMVIDDLAFAQWEFVEKGVVRDRTVPGRTARLQRDGETFKVDSQ